MHDSGSKKTHSVPSGQRLAKQIQAKATEHAEREMPIYDRGRSIANKILVLAKSNSYPKREETVHVQKTAQRCEHSKMLDETAG